jgi:hypothetical protein
MLMNYSMLRATRYQQHDARMTTRRSLCLLDYQPLERNNDYNEEAALSLRQKCKAGYTLQTTHNTVQKYRL